MQSVTDGFLSALTGSHTPVIKADVWYDGELVAGDLPIVSGQVKGTDDGKAIRHDLNLTVADPDGRLVPRSESDVLAPFGSVVNIRAGMKSSSGSAETVSLGWFRIDTCDADEAWSLYTGADGTQVWSSRGASVAVTGVDKAEAVKDAIFTGPQQVYWPPSVRDEVRHLCDGLVAVALWPGVTDVPVPASVVYSTDRWAAICDLAVVLSATPAINPHGELVFRPNAAGASVWTIAGGPGGVQVSAATRLSRSDVFNSVISRGESTSTQAAVQATVIENSGPLRWDGPFGRVPFVRSDPLITTTVQAQADATATQARMVARRSFELDVTCVTNYALEVGDTVTVVTPYGSVDGRVTSATWPLTPGPMTLTVVVPRVSYWALFNNTGLYS